MLIRYAIDLSHSGFRVYGRGLWGARHNSHTSTATTTRPAFSDMGCAAPCGLGLTRNNLPGVGRQIGSAESQEVAGILVFVGLFCLHTRPFLPCIRCVPRGGHAAAPSVPSACAAGGWAERISLRAHVFCLSGVPALPLCPTFADWLRTRRAGLGFRV